MEIKLILRHQLKLTYVRIASAAVHHSKVIYKTAKGFKDYCLFEPFELCTVATIYFHVIPGFDPVFEI